MSGTHQALVLVIEDEKPVRDSFREYLTDRGYRVSEAADGVEGLKQFKERTPDIVLLDLRMPEMDGHEVLRRLSAESPDTPLVVVSGTGDIHDTINALHLGAWDYLHKPITDLNILDHSIAQALEKARLIAENREHQRSLEEQVERRTRELTTKMEELERFNKLAIGRERRIIELKRLINELLGELGRAPRFESPEKIDADPSQID